MPSSRLLVFLVGASMPLLACNALVGVEEVTRVQNSSGAGGTAGGAGLGGAGAGGSAGGGAAGLGGSPGGSAGKAGSSGTSGQGGTDAGAAGSGGQGGDSGAGGVGGQGGDAGVGGVGGQGGDAGVGGVGGQGGDSGAGGSAGDGGDGGAGGNAGQGGGGEAGEAGAGGVSGASGQGGAAGASGAAGQGGSGGAGQGGSGGSVVACEPEQGGPWKTGQPLDRLSLKHVQDLVVSTPQPPAFSGPNKLRGTWSFLREGRTALRVGWGGNLVRYDRDPVSGKLTVAPAQPFGSMFNAASLLMHPQENRVIVGGGNQLGDGSFQLYEFDYKQQTITTLLDSSKQNASLATPGYLDVRRTAYHPLARWLYAAMAQSSDQKKSALAVLETVPVSSKPDAKFSLLQTVELPSSWSLGLAVSPDGTALYVGGLARISRLPIDLDTGKLGAPVETLLPGSGGQNTNVFSGAVCQHGALHHVYSPFLSIDQNVAKNGLWHTIHEPGKPVQSKLYGLGTSSALVRGYQAVASKDCSRLFVTAASFTGNSTYLDGYVPSLHVFTINPASGALSPESTLEAEKDFQGIYREPQVTLSPDERHLYLSSEWMDNVSIFEIERTPAGAWEDPLALRVGAPYLSDLMSPGMNPSAFYAQDLCPPGQVLRGFTGLINTNSGKSYNKVLARLRPECSKVRVEQKPGQPPGLAFSPGLSGFFRGGWGGATEPWSNLCSDGSAAVGFRPFFFKIAEGSYRLIDLELECAPLSLPCKLPYQIEIGPSTKQNGKPLVDGATTVPQNGTITCPSGMVASGSNILNGDLIDNMGLVCSQLGLVVSPGECTKDTDCPSSGNECDYGACVQGHCQAQRMLPLSPTRRQNSELGRICNSPSYPPTTFHVFDATTPDPFDIVPYPVAKECMTCEGLVCTPKPVPVSCAFQEGKACTHYGACVGAWP